MGRTNPDRTAESRRSFLGRAAFAGCATTGLLPASGPLAGALQPEHHDHPDTAITFADSFAPRTPFRVTSRLQQPTTNRILDPVVVDPTDWYGHVCSYVANAPVGYFEVFVREEPLTTAVAYRFGTDSTFFSRRLGRILVRASLEVVEETTTVSTTDARDRRTTGADRANTTVSPE